MADNTPNSVYSLEGDPNERLNAQGGAISIDPESGDIYARSPNSLPGTTGWELVNVGSGGSNAEVTLNGVQTLTNKTLSGDNNTFSNIPNTAISYSGLTANGVLQASSTTSVTTTLTPSGLTSIGVNTVNAGGASTLTLNSGGAASAITLLSGTPVYGIRLLPTASATGAAIESAVTLSSADGGENVHFQLDTTGPTVTTNSSHQIISAHPFFSQWSIANGITDSGQYVGEKINIYASSASMLGTLAHAWGSWIRLGLSVTGGATARITDATGVLVDTELNGAGTITNFYGFRMSVQTSPVATTAVTNLYGLVIPDITLGTTTNLAIQTGLGQVLFGDSMAITRATNAPVGCTTSNGSTGTAATAFLKLRCSNSDAGQCAVAMTSTGFTPYGALAANSGYLYSNGARLTIMADSGSGVIHFATGGNTSKVNIDATGNLSVTAGTISTLGGASFHTTTTALTNGAGVGAGTILTAPSAGNPTKWIGINDNGTTRYIPAW